MRSQQDPKNLRTFRRTCSVRIPGLNPLGGPAESLPPSPNSVYHLVQDVRLTAILAHRRNGHRPRSSALQMAIAVCLVVLMLLALVHVADGHSTAGAADCCPICVVMHSVVPFVIMAVVMALIRIETQAPKLLELRAIIRYWHPNLFTRPPPAGC